MSSKGVLNKLYTGGGGLDFVGRRRTWYWTTAAILLVCLVSIALRGFSLGIDFVGGTKINMPAGNLETASVSKTFEDATGVEPKLVQIVGAGDTRILEINSKRLSEEQIGSARQALFEAYKPADASGKQTPDAIGDSTVSESWGSTITKRMLISMFVFLVAVFIYIAVRLEREMAVAAITALLIDFVAIAGIYALLGFEVSPATIIGLLTVLAFSLYDTVIVFDRVRENTAGYLGNRSRTYAEHANLAVNQTVMRSISTTVISALPILALIVIAVWLLGVGTLKDLALVQLIGVIEGTFSSVFLATPILVSLKNRSKETKAHNAEVEEHRNPQNKAKDSVENSGDVYVSDLSQSHKRTVSSPTSTGASWRPQRR
ncbi:protein translocase subunit SecF [Corynebacterium pseudotuberculosis]|uniref:Protein-export membrane protein SecF n=1 Tax=Corynebacterium pseudotuberculosis (strain C231) TaxID=681645 RepID=D9QAR8_CORP2|nr:protein translocase subunit SecF [Corynebacterium pseudotuberculosis]ADL10644.1 protein translocase subunit SecF [Corynebacterium pseudotuberculosis C231]ADO26443.1 protein translocase subunit SecF [Corynebacterium pseudotuberculosis I19]AEK92507.1 Protein-export membrane protein secF [Corynebacterium pseudotuberculosis PAT10]AEP70417.1 Protein-export membrane protein secF [Corynebacterium pseudotuberculosis 42/02-A]AFF22328.1 Protein-export membrane protein secF [Corynebacterium pseudotube